MGVSKFHQLQIQIPKGFLVVDISSLSHFYFWCLKWGCVNTLRDTNWNPPKKP